MRLIAQALELVIGGIFLAGYLCAIVAAVVLVAAAMDKL
jgi:uncharacterized membrane protein YccF (DUF307 family)